MPRSWRNSTLRQRSHRLRAAPFDLPPGSRIVDVSQAQLPIDWQAVKAAGIVGVMVRATQGIATSQPVGVDTAFVGHVEGALASGLRVGVYHAFLGAREGVPQADFFLETIAPYLDKLRLPIAVDVEVSNGQTPAVVADRLYNMLTRLETRLGYKVMIYTAAGVWNAMVGDAHDAYFTQHPLWVAHWID